VVTVTVAGVMTATAAVAVAVAVAETGVMTATTPAGSTRTTATRTMATPQQCWRRRTSPETGLEVAPCRRAAPRFRVRQVMPKPVPAGPTRCETCRVAAPIADRNPRETRVPSREVAAIRAAVLVMVNPPSGTDT
jgi:hypothetical protein